MGAALGGSTWPWPLVSHKVQERGPQELQPVVSLAAAHGPWSALASAVVAHRLGCSAAYGVFSDQGLSMCLLHWLLDSHPLYNQGSPGWFLFYFL